MSVALLVLVIVIGLLLGVVGLIVLAAVFYYAVVRAIMRGIGW